MCCAGWGGQGMNEWSLDLHSRGRMFTSPLTIEQGWWWSWIERKREWFESIETIHRLNAVSATPIHLSHTLAFQTGNKRGNTGTHLISNKGFPWPDKTIVLNLNRILCCCVCAYSGGKKSRIGTIVAYPVIFECMEFSTTGGSAESSQISPNVGDQQRVNTWI